MADTIERIYKITADASQAIAQLDKLNKTTGSIDKSLSSFGETIKSTFEKLAIAEGIKVAAEQLLNVAEGMDQISKASQKFGISTENLVALKDAAALSDVPFENLTIGLKKLAIGMDELASGKSSNAADTLKQLGINVKESNGALRDTGEVLIDVAEQFLKMPAGAQKTADAVKIFGKAGADLIPLLNEGKEGLEEFRKEAENLGLTFDRVSGKEAEAFNDNLKKMGMVAEGAKTQLTIGLLPALTQITEEFTHSSTNANSFREAGEKIGKAFLVTKDFLDAFWDTLKSGGEVIAALAKNFAALDFAFSHNDFKNLGSNLSESWAEATDNVAKNTEHATEAITKGFDLLAQDSHDIATKFSTEFAAGLKAAPSPEIDITPKIDPKALADLNKQFQSAIDAVIPGAKALHEYQEAIDLVNQAQKQHIGTQEQYSAILDAAAKKNLEAADITGDLAKANAELAKSAQTLVDAVDPAAKAQRDYGETLNIANEALKAQIISQEQYEAIMGKATQNLFDATDATNELNKSTSALTEISTAVGQTLSSGISSFVDTLTSTSKSFKQWAADMVVSIAKVIAQLLILKAIKSSDTFGQFFASGAAFSSLGLPYGVYNQPTSFAMAGTGQRYFATGGVGTFAEAGPEAIMPLSRDTSGRLGVDSAAPVVNVNVHNNADATARVEQNGNTIDIIIDRISGDILRGGGKVSKALENTYKVGRARR